MKLLRFEQLVLGMIALLALLPVLAVSSDTLKVDWLDLRTLAAVNLLGWAIVGFLIYARSELRRTSSHLASQFGIDSRVISFEALLRRLIYEVERKYKAFSVSIIEGRITSRQQLTKSLQSIVTASYDLLNAESAELALFDHDSGLYHSSFVLGRPFRIEAHAMLAEALKSENGGGVLSPEIIIQPVSFSGTILGCLRVALARDCVPSTSDRELLRLLALQGSLAIINSRYADELMRMKRVSEESVKAKTGFLANLSHEIRGPLGIILNAVELVLDGLCGPLTQDSVETLRMVRQNGEHLLELINDVLDYAKVESGKIVPEKAEILVQEILEDIAGVVRTQAESKRHKLIVRPQSDVLALSCDRRHMRQMLINLLTNAIKYTPDGGTIELWAERTTGNKVKINVTDSGVGIEASERHRVFAQLEREQHSYSIAQAGTGLGMPLTKRLADVNGATIDFSSVPGSGSHFWLIFPAIQFNPFMTEAPKLEQAEASGHGERILFLERDDGEASMVARYLISRGFEVLIASTRKEALDLIKSHSIHLVIVDNNITDDPGEDFISPLRNALPSDSKIKFVLLSSRAFIFDIEHYLRIGIDRCLTKPVSLKELGRVCREMLDGKAMERAEQEREKTTQSTQETSAATGKLIKPKSKHNDLVH